MTAAETAVVVTDGRPSVTAEHLTRLLDFFGIPWHRQTADAREAPAQGSYAVLTSLPIAGAVVAGNGTVGGSSGMDRFWQGAAAVYACPTDDEEADTEALRSLLGDPLARIERPRVPKQQVSIVADPELAGPMAGLKLAIRCAGGDRLLVSGGTLAGVDRLIEGEGGSLFLRTLRPGVPFFVGSCAEVPDVWAIERGRYFDVRERFCQAVPVVMFLRHVFRTVGWQSRETGACVVLDDPALVWRYGFCDFGLLDRLTREQPLSVSIAFIPWNWRRTSSRVADLIRSSRGRLSLSVHGCDHTRAEFGSTSLAVLSRQTHRACERMERHAQRTGLAYDRVMVFPQGIFSPEALRVLQQYGFMAAVNTEVAPPDGVGPRPTVGDLWSVAAQGYASFPLFTRRPVEHGVENFAFDALLGKPCLLVEHHGGLREGGRRVSAITQALNSMSASLRWRSLGDVVRSAYQWQGTATGARRVRMFANELCLANEGADPLEYLVEKANRGSVGVTGVRVNGQPVPFSTDGAMLRFTCRLTPGAEAVLSVAYSPPDVPPAPCPGLRTEMKIAVRRCLSEFRDRVLDRNETLHAITERACGRLRRRSPSASDVSPLSPCGQ